MYCRAAHLRTHWALINGLRVFWVTAVLWCECGVFLWSLLDCRWPDNTPTSLAPSTHILLVADPQVLDDDSYPGRPSWLMTLTRYIVDFNLRKSWNAVLAKLDPHTVVFLGDMMDNGRASMGDEEYARYYQRFKSIFHLPPATPVYYLPGNHDVGLGSALRHSSHARERYQRHFGEFNQRFEISNHTFLLLDAPGLADENYRYPMGENQDRKVGKGKATEFLHDLAKQPPSGPVVLLSHIPLSRSEHSSCGPLREKGTIRPGVGGGYQNLLHRETSEFILEHLRPAVVFSGDDHDYCEYVHMLRDGSKVREVTVKSFSMAMGIQRPGFQLLSLSPVNSPSGSAFAHSSITTADKACLLPNQIKIYQKFYAPIAALTILFLSILSYKYRHHRLAKGSLSTEVAVQHESSIFRWMFATTQHRISRPASPTPSTFRSDPYSLHFHEDEESYDLNGVLPGVADLISPRIGTFDSSRLGALRVPHVSESNNCAIFPARRGTRLSVGSMLDRVARACRVFSRGPWFRRVVWDLSQVAWPPLCVYTIMSLWVFWWRHIST